MTMKKRVLPILVAVMMVFAMMPMTAGTVYADEIEVDVDGFKCKLDQEQKTAVICGRGDGLNLEDGALRIPETVTYSDETYPVTKIDNEGREIYWGDDITFVTLPASLISIGNRAFIDCGGLTTVSIEENSSLTTIGSNAFNGCSNLSAIDIPPSVKEIGPSCFDSTGIESIVLPEGLTEIESYLFNNCKSLKVVTIPSTVTAIWYWVFGGCDALTTIYFNGTRAQWDAIYKGMGKPDIEPICKEDPPSDWPPAQVTVKGTSIRSLAGAKKVITVKWKKQTAKVAGSNITGYQIRLATDSKFTKNKKTVTVKGYKNVSKKVTGLKAKKKYYVKIRTFKTISGKKYYSPWTKAKTVKTK